jgi:hypothetical protein
MFGTSGKHHSVPKQITNADDFGISVIRRTVYGSKTASKIEGNHKFQRR